MTYQQKFIEVFGKDMWQQMIVFMGLADQFKEVWISPYTGESQPSEEDIHREREQAYMLGYEDASKKFRTELQQRREADKLADAQLKELIEEVRK